jgi:uncharacterized protein YigA (DUF484 family)
MTDTPLSAQEVADFLRDNPQFFETHADVFAAMRVPHPHEPRAISLGERQILTLRDRNRELEWRLNELTHNATSNESITARLTQWCASLLAENDTQRLPGEITLGLARQFDLNEVALRLWRLPGLPEAGYGAPVSEDIRTFADSLATPYCGTDTEFEAASWLAAKPRSLALVALRPEAGERSVGLLVLGSDDPDRFTPDMGTSFLDLVATLASAALRRLA